MDITLRILIGYHNIIIVGSILLATFESFKIKAKELLGDNRPFVNEKNLRSLVVGFIILFLSGIMYYTDVTGYHIGFDLPLWKHIVLFIYGLTLYWTVFDLTLNIRRGKSITYTSDNGDDTGDALSDRIFNILFPEPFSGIIQLGVKLTILVCTWIIIL